MDWFLPVFWCVVLVVLPGVGQAMLVRRLWKYRIDRPAARPPRLSRRGLAWTWADASSGSYSPPGKRLLAGVHALQAVQMIGTVAWAAIFIL